MDLVSRNPEKVAEYLSQHPCVYQVNYLGLESFPLHNLAKKYMKLVDSDDGTGKEINRYGHLLSFRVDGPPQNAMPLIIINISFGVLTSGVITTTLFMDKRWEG